MKKLLLTLSSVGALALASCAPHTHQTATDTACPVCGKEGCTTCATNHVH